MERTWRWFGKNDKITLDMLRQIGVEGIVTALHDVPNGEVWTRQKIKDLKDYIESYGMRWSVVESLPVCESIKYAGPDRDQLIENYKESLKNLSLEGIHTICYDSDADSITITHDAHSRKGFALGAVLAAEYTKEHDGLLTTKDLFKF